MEPLTGDDPRRIGRYDVLGRIGAGGMGRVYLGQSASGRKVAIKVVHQDYADSPEFRARFGREIAAMRAVGGFYTAAVVDADPDAERPWLATEYVDGPPLDRFVREHGPLSGEPLRMLAVGLAEALTAIHGAGLVHRDFKPSNVLLAPDGPRVIDFGIAWAFDATALTAAHQMIGSPGFMAPEQLTHGTVTAAADVFCLGLTLAYAATGRLPFGTGGMLDLSFRVVNNEPDLTGLPAALAGVVQRCLAKDPARRPVIREVLDELTGGPVTQQAATQPAAPPGAQPPTQVPIPPQTQSAVPNPFATDGDGAGPRGRKRSSSIAVSSAAALVLVAGLGTWYLTSGKDSGSGGDAVTTSKAATSGLLSSSLPTDTNTTPTTPTSSATSSAAQTITVGSANFPENQLLAEIYAQALTAKGFPVTKKLNVGSREVLYPLVGNGTVSVVPEYNGALLAYLDKSSTARTVEDTDAALTAKLDSTLEILNPAPADDNYALVVKPSAATKDLKSISDLARVSRSLTLGAPPEFQTRRPDGLLGLRDGYGLTFASFKPLDNGGPSTVAALRQNQIQVAMLYSTDPDISHDGWLALTDDKHVFGAENVVPLVNKAALPPGAAEALNAVSAKLTTADVSRLNEQVQMERKDVADVAHAWLANAGLA